MRDKLIFYFFTLFAFISINTQGQKLQEIKFSKADTSLADCEFVYPNFKASNYLDSLRITFKIDQVVSNCKSDLDKVIALLAWTNKQWEHNGLNEPTKNDAISILYEAGKGQNFRCVEYGIVLAASLNSIGITARSIGLKTKNVETQKSGAGHVATEAYLNDLGKWIFIDPQMNLIPTLNGIPLNAVELNRALYANPSSVIYLNENGEASNSRKKRYNKWIAPYLFYFDVKIDNRYGIDKEEIVCCNGKRVLQLVPLGEKNPSIFQINFKMDYCVYTHNLELFYSKPVNLK